MKVVNMGNIAEACNCDDLPAKSIVIEVRVRRRSSWSCSSCVHSGCCDTYCGGRCWERDERENDSGEEKEE